MRLENVQMNKFQTYENNPRDHDSLITPLVEAISRFGFRVPILVREDGSVIDGHGRIKAAKRLGMTSIPAIILDVNEILPPELERAFRISINELAQKADWNQDKLLRELEELKSKYDFQELAKLTSFDQDLLEDLLTDTEELEDVGGTRPNILEYSNEVEFSTKGRFDFPQLLDGPFYNGPAPVAWLGDDDGVTHPLYTYSTDSAANLPWERTIMCFWTADNKFQRVWQDTAGFVTRLKERPIAGVVTPDFSVFLDAPLPLRLMAAYQSLFVGRYLQEAGIPIIVNLSTCVKDAEGFLESIPPHSPLARQMQSNMSRVEAENERRLLDMVRIFAPSYLWVYAPPKFVNTFEKELQRIKNVYYILPRLWARKQKLGF